MEVFFLLCIVYLYSVVSERISQSYNEVTSSKNEKCTFTTQENETRYDLSSLYETIYQSEIIHGTKFRIVVSFCQDLPFVCSGRNSVAVLESKNKEICSSIGDNFQVKELPSENGLKFKFFGTSVNEISFGGSWMIPSIEVNLICGKSSMLTPIRESILKERGIEAIDPKTALIKFDLLSPHACPLDSNYREMLTLEEITSLEKGNIVVCVIMFCVILLSLYPVIAGCAEIMNGKKSDKEVPTLLGMVLFCGIICSCSYFIFFLITHEKAENQVNIMNNTVTEIEENMQIIDFKNEDEKNLGLFGKEKYEVLDYVEFDLEPDNDCSETLKGSNCS